MIPSLTAQRLSNELGTPRRTPEVYRIPVRWPNGELAYNATSGQEVKLRAAGAVTEVRSPSGILRYLKLNRSWQFSERDAEFRWQPRMSANTIVMQAQRLTPGRK